MKQKKVKSKSNHVFSVDSNINSFLIFEEQHLETEKLGLDLDGCLIWVTVIIRGKADLS